MEPRQQLIAWQKQVDARPDAREADMDVAKRLLKHGIDSADEIARLRAQAQHEADCAEAYRAEADSLRDEHASLSAQLIAFQTAWPGGVDEVSSVIESLRDENAKLLADAARYRWLRNEHDVDLPIGRISWKRNSNRNCGEWVNLIDGSDLDRHIDAAMGKGE